MARGEIVGIEATQARAIEAIRNPKLAVNFEAEQGVLGSLLANNSLFQVIGEDLRAEHFADPLHGRIYAVIADMIGAGRPVDAVLLKGHFENEPGLSAVGGAGYLVRLAASLVSSVAAPDYAATVRDCWARRQLTELAGRMAASAFDVNADMSLPALAQGYEGELKTIAQAGLDPGADIADAAESVGAFVERAERSYKAAGQPLGLLTGLSALDRLMGGMMAQDLTIIASRPSMGKTSLALSIADHVARKGFVVGFWSLEMSAEQLSGRLLSARCEVPYSKVRGGGIAHDEMARLAAGRNALVGLPLHIEAKGGLPVSEIAAAARRMKRRRGINLIVVDYLQLMRGPAGTRWDNRVQEVGEISRSLKTLAMDLDVPVIAMAQLSRATENREDKRPQMSDLRESGAIENDADQILFLFRQHYYLSRSSPMRKSGESASDFSERQMAHDTATAAVAGKATLYFDKNRHGATGVVHLAFRDELMTFSDLEDERPAATYEPGLL